MEHAWVALHIACHVQFTVMSIGHASHALHYNSFSTLWRSAYCRDEFKAESNITTNGRKVVEDVGLLNMIIKQTLCSIHKFDHEWFHTPTATSFSLQIILSSSVARLANLEKKNFPINQNALFPEILHSRILFLLIQLGSKVLGQSAV